MNAVARLIITILFGLFGIHKFIDKIFSLKALGKTHKQIGLIVGLTADQVSGIVRWHKEKAIQDPTKVSCIAHA